MNWLICLTTVITPSSSAQGTTYFLETPAFEKPRSRDSGMFGQCLKVNKAMPWERGCLSGVILVYSYLLRCQSNKNG